MLIVGCLLASLISGWWLLAAQRPGETLRISYDGEVLYTMELKDMENSHGGEDGKAEYLLITYSDSEETPAISRASARPDIPTDTAYNLLCIAAGQVTMEAADCPDQICVHHKPLTGDLESVICLPHKLVVELVGGTQENTAIDGMVN